MDRFPLILLFGLPRSGTTWLGKIFDSHPDTLYRHEPDSWERLEGIPLAPEREPSPEVAERLRSFAAALPRMRATKVAGSLPLFPKSYRSRLGFQIHRGNVLAAKAIGRLTGEFPIPGRSPDPDSDHLRVVWKSIESVGRMGLVARSLPEARGVLLVRHPCGFAASVLRGERERHFTSAVPASEDYGIFEALLETPQARRRGLTRSDLEAMRPEERLAWRWALYNEKAMEDLAGLERFEVVRYEDLCQAPKAVTGRMFERTGLAMNSQTEAFLGQSSSSSGGGYYSVYQDSSRKASGWRSELTDETADRILAVVRHTLPGRLYWDSD